MNLVYGEVVDVNVEEGIQIGTVRISGVKKKIVLDLLNGVQCGDRILICDGIAIGKVADERNAQQGGDGSVVIRHSSFVI
jgi:hydrogenase maturation factor